MVKKITVQRKWTTNDFVALRQYYKNRVSRKKIARVLNRTVGSVGRKASLLGLKNSRGLDYLAEEDYSKIPREKWIYLAGLFDGEGCIYLHLNRKCSVILYIGMTDGCVIRWLKDTFGGKTRIVLRPKGERKQAYSWEILSSQITYNILMHIYPYLIVKRYKAKQAIERIEKTYSLR